MFINLATPSLFRQDISQRLTLDLFYNTLTDLGHDVIINFDHNIYIPGAFNVIFNPQLLIKHYPDAVRNVLSNPHNYCVFETEPLNEDGLSYGEPAPDAEGNDHNKYSEKDVTLLKEFLGNAKFIMCPVMGSGPGLRKYNPNFEFFKYGYHKSLEKIRHAEFKLYDVLFYGSSATRERLDVLDSISSSGLSFANLGYVDYLMRDTYIATSRVILNINWSKYLGGFVASSRAVICSANRIACLTNKVKDDEDYLKYCHVTTNEDWVEQIVQYRDSGMIRPEGIRVYEELRSDPPMSKFWIDTIKKYL
jgi:hypothetical protein